MWRVPLGWLFVIFYNGKFKNGYERISDAPQIVRTGDLWVMFYFGAFWQPRHLYLFL